MATKSRCRKSAAAASKPYERSELGRSAPVIVQSADGSEKFTLFYGNHTFLSNFYPSPFTVQGVEFNCGEQYFHYKKAEHFGDESMKSKILQAESPMFQKSLGRKVSGYKEDEWKEAGPRYMKEALVAKFEQNAELRTELLSTSDTVLVEASARDRKWGIGLGLHDPRAADRKQWRGGNLLGRLLMEVRDELSL